MPEFRTTNCKDFGQPEIRFSIDAQSSLDVEWLITFFQKSVADGKRFRPNETIQIGWMVLLLKDTESGDLELFEPQFDSIPIKWISGVNNTLRQLILQKSVAALLNVEPIFPTLRQSGLASQSFLQTASQSEFRMKREKFSGNDSGWRFDLNQRADRIFNCRSLYELSFFQMTIVPFLALPANTTIIKNGNEFVLELGQFSIDSRKSPLLQSIAQMQIWV